MRGNEPVTNCNRLTYLGKMRKHSTISEGWGRIVTPLLLYK